MKLIIDIPDEYYKSIKNTTSFISGQRNGKTLTNHLCNAVANGIPYISNNVELISGLIKQVEAMEPEVNVMDPNAWEVYDNVMDILNNCLKEGD